MRASAKGNCINKWFQSLVHTCATECASEEWALPSEFVKLSSICTGALKFPSQKIEQGRASSGTASVEENLHR